MTSLGRIFAFLSSLLLPAAAQAASPSAGAMFVYEGLLTDTAGTPITSPQTVTLQITTGDSTCTMYEETHNVAPGGQGEFSVIVGSGTRTDSTNNTADRIFAVSGSATCTSGGTTSFSGSYAQRRLRVQVGATTLTPDIVINNVPFAINAARLEDKRASDFVQTSANISQSRAENIFSRYSILDSLLTLYSAPAGNGQILIGNGTGFSPSTLTAGAGINITNGPGSITISASGGAGSVTSVTALSPLVVNNGTTTPEISMPAANGTSGGYLTASDWTTFSNKMDKTLADGKVFVGNGGVATAVSVSGDATLSNVGTLTLNSVNTAGTYFKVVTDSKGRVTSGSASLVSGDIPNLDWSKITSGKPTTIAGYGITDAVMKTGDVMSGALNMGSNDLVNTGHIVMSSQKTLRLGTYTDAQETTLTGTLSAVHVGYSWYNSTSNQIKYWNGSAAVALGSAGAGITSLTGDVTASGAGSVPATISSNAVTTGKILDSTILKADLNFGGTNAATSGMMFVDNAGKFFSFVCSTAGQVPTWTATGFTCQIPAGSGGTVTSVNGSGPVQVLNSTTNPTISVNDATTSAKGVVQIGSGLNVSAGVISANPSTFPSTVPVSKGGTGVTTLAANKLLMANGTGDALAEFSCALGQIITFNASNVPGCTTYTGAGLLLNGGNSFTAPINIGTNDNQPMSFKTNNATRMTLDETGRVGIGTGAPSAPLTVAGSGEVAQFISNSTGGIAVDTTATNYNPSLIMKKSGLKRWTIMVDANLETGSNAGSNLSILRHSDAGSVLGSAMTIDRASGNVGIATPNPLYTLQVTGTAALSSSTAWTMASDQRLKDVDGQFEYGLNEILQLRTVRYHYKKDNPMKLPADQPLTGFIAQEVQKVIPDAVRTNSRGYLELNVDPIHWATVNAVQELHGMCKASEEQIQSINRRVASLETEAAEKDQRIRKLEEENQSLKKDLELIKAKLGLQ
nr:hypothetical protein HAGR004_33300 [Bdellovibrio sp. HAGR004]